ncbi:MAG: metallophosphoesterase family protein, partial [Spirochaetales bacterium]|nr:metallophosphoesterase family protein [Spirochaetales bacterium]
TDAHHAPGTGRDTIKAMGSLIDRTEPDLVFLDGDNIAGHATEQNCRDMIADIASPMEERGIPWAHVYGNHDKTPLFPKEFQQAIYRGYPHCLSQSGPDGVPGVGNYFLPVLGHDGKPVFGIWALDSMQDLDIMDRPLDYKGDFRKDVLLPNRLTTGSDADFIRFEQVQWYCDESKRLESKYGARIPSIMCFHQPLYEFNAIVRNPVETMMVGEAYEKISCSEINSGLFAATIQRADVIGMFCGHDHNNNFDGIYCNMHLAYCGSVGYHAYGMKTGDREGLRGGRVVDISLSDPWTLKTEYIFTKSQSNHSYFHHFD